MSKLIIRGGKPLSGHHIVPGNKNAALPMLAATLLADGPVTLTNLPNIADVRVMADGLVALGAKVTGSIAEHTLTVDPRRLRADPVLPADICTRIRTSFLFVGPLLARKGRIRLRGAPGGDSIGRRRLDTHVNGFTALGAKVTLRKTGSATALAPKGLLGTDFMLDEASVMGTENLVMAAVLAKGRTVLYNTACEPHVQNLCAMLNQMGAKIEGIGTNRLVIEGVQRLSGGTFRVGGDAIEAASYLIAAAATRGSITLQGVSQADMAVLQPAFRKLGVRWVWEDEDTLRLPPRQRLRTAYDLGAAIPKIEDGPWPMIPSDLLSPLIVLATQTRGTELFFEKMFESRMFFIDYLIRMGADIILCDPHRAVVRGRSILKGRHVISPDVRAGMALVVAALSAEGESVISNIEQIERGYDHLLDKLVAIGASIRRNEH